MSYGPVTERRIPGGGPGVSATVRAMRRQVRRALRDPWLVEAAARIVSSCSGSEACRARRIREWVDRYFEFVPDPLGVETLKTPRYMLERIRAEGVARGDCDDVAMLAAALGQAVGLRARFVLVGFTARGPAEHVWAELATGEGWVELDTTRPDQLPDGLRIMTRETVEV